MFFARIEHIGKESLSFGKGLLGKGQEVPYSSLIRLIRPCSGLIPRLILERNDGPPLAVRFAQLASLEETASGIESQWISSDLDAQREPIPLATFQEAFDQTLHKEPRIPFALNFLLAQALLREATDLHLDPRDGQGTASFRLDGLVTPVATMPLEVLRGLIIRLKVMGRLPVHHVSHALESSIAIDFQETERCLRVTILPTVHGERAALRVFQKDLAHWDLERLGVSEETRDGLLRLLEQPSGMLVLTGPANSGKTTTLYAILKEMRRLRPGRVIISVEDPIEYRLDGITQTEARPAQGFTFQQALKTVLRSDPEVLMIGEIRDPETAEIAFQTALTGHWVLTAVHSGSAAEALQRLLELNISPSVEASALRGVLAQRLVRKTCPECGGLGRDSCAMCEGTGCKGLMLLDELMEITPELREMILRRASTQEVACHLYQSAPDLLCRLGRERAQQGFTTADELRRVGLLLQEGTP